MKTIIAIMTMCLIFTGARSQNIVDIGKLIHLNRVDKDESDFFYDVRRSIIELSQWPNEKNRDTIYSLESWNYEYGTFLLMYWNRDKTISVSQDNMNDSLTVCNQRAYPKRIIAQIEEWDLDKINNSSKEEAYPQIVYATRILLTKDHPFIVNTVSFPYIFLIEDIEDAMELYEIWNPKNSIREKQ